MNLAVLASRFYLRPALKSTFNNSVSKAPVPTPFKISMIVVSIKDDGWKRAEASRSYLRHVKLVACAVALISERLICNRDFRSSSHVVEKDRRFVVPQM